MKYLCSILILFSSQFCLAIGDKPYNKSYDPNRNPFSDFEAAKLDAKAQKKLILLEFGGDWCVWCHRLDDFFENQNEAANKMSGVFVVLKVNVSEENSNEKFIKQFSKAPGYPHFIIANANGHEIGAMGTSKLEEGKSYSLPKMLEFIEIWKKNNN